MRIPRIYHDGKLTVGATVQLSLAASHHLLKVLRAKPGSNIILFNGEAGEYTARLIDSPYPKQVCAQLENFLTTLTESPLQIHLFQAISRGEKMDFTIQKAVELGVNKITPLFTEFSNVKLNEERGEKKIRHWQQIIISACEQSGRTSVPTINPPINFHLAITECKETFKLILHPMVDQHLAELTSPPKVIALLVGAEGGFSEAEIKLAMQQGFIPLQLGPRILRTETAGLAALAILQSKWGDMG